MTLQTQALSPGFSFSIPFSWTGSGAAQLANTRESALLIVRPISFADRHGSPWMDLRRCRFESYSLQSHHFFFCLRFVVFIFHDTNTRALVEVRYILLFCRLSHIPLGLLTLLPFLPVRPGYQHNLYRSSAFTSESFCIRQEYLFHQSTNQEVSNR